MVIIWHPAEAAVSLPLFSWTEESKYNKRVKIKKGSDHSTITVTSKTDSICQIINLIYCKSD